MATVGEKPWKVEYAKSGRSSCRTCKSSIEKEQLRLGKMVQSPKFDGLMPVMFIIHSPRVYAVYCSVPTVVVKKIKRFAYGV